MGVVKRKAATARNSSRQAGRGCAPGIDGGTAVVSTERHSSVTNPGWFRALQPVRNEVRGAARPGVLQVNSVGRAANLRWVRTNPLSEGMAVHLCSQLRAAWRARPSRGRRGSRQRNPSQRVTQARPEVATTRLREARLTRPFSRALGRGPRSCCAPAALDMRTDRDKSDHGS
jgi:hypothetical protein